MYRPAVGTFPSQVVAGQAPGIFVHAALADHEPAISAVPAEQALGTADRTGPLPHPPAPFPLFSGHRSVQLFCSIVNDTRNRSGNEPIHSEVASVPQLWFESKAPADEKAQPTLVAGEHFEEAGNAALGPQMRFWSHF
jgi:hypothetical protein